MILLKKLNDRISFINVSSSNFFINLLKSVPSSIIMNLSSELIKKLGEKSIKIELDGKLSILNKDIQKYNLELDDNKKFLTFKYNIKENTIKLTEMLNEIEKQGIKIKDFIRTYKVSN